MAKARSITGDGDEAVACWQCCCQDGSRTAIYALASSCGIQCPVYCGPAACDQLAAASKLSVSPLTLCHSPSLSLAGQRHFSYECKISAQLARYIASYSSSSCCSSFSSSFLFCGCCCLCASSVHTIKWEHSMHVNLRLCGKSSKQTEWALV